MKNIIIVICLFFLISRTAFSATETITRTVHVYAGISCHEWNATLADKDSIEGRITDLSHSAWLAGYITGINFGSTREGLLDGIDMHTVMDWSDIYCRDHPKNQITDAVDALLAKLGRSR